MNAEAEVVQYTAYADLVDREVVHIEPTDWKEQFLWIDGLRVLNKFHKCCVLEHWDQVTTFCDSLRSNVQKNALMLLRESIQYRQLYDRRVVTKVIEKCDSDFKFLKNEALQTLNVLASKQYNKEIIASLSAITMANNYRVQLHSYPALVKIVCASDFDCEWEPIIQATLSVYDGKSVECRKASEQLYAALQDKKPDVLLQELAQPLQVIGQRLKSKKPQLSFKDFIKQQKE